MTNYGDAMIGEGEAKYAGPEKGPFRCDRCTHYEPDRKSPGAGRCEHPIVIEGPTHGNVMADGCCSYFHNRPKPSMKGKHGR